jgi:REP element-mobilizing transposase RayT
MTGPPIFLDREKAEVLFEQFRETATHRGWTIRAVAIMANHWHMVVQVPDDPPPGKILADFKAYGSRALNRKHGKPPSDTWWTAKGSKRKLGDDRALEAGSNYVLYKQPNPLLVWSPELGRII